jgi:predicted oxidoreductase
VNDGGCRSACDDFTAISFSNEMQEMRSLFRRTILKNHMESLVYTCVPSDLWLCLQSFSFSCSNLKLEYLDLYLIHWPLRFTTNGLRRPKPEEVYPLDIHKTWKAMEECVELGLTKSIGVSNFSSKKIMDLVSTANIVPAVNQVST